MLKFCETYDRLDEKVIQQNWTQSKKNTKQAFMFKS